MLREIYLRPVGLYPRQRSIEAEEVWGGLNLAGGWLDFSALEIIERNGARVERRISGIGELIDRDWGRRSSSAADMFGALCETRPRLAGLSLDVPRIMGIVNVTPDSFSDGGRHLASAAAIEHAFKLEEDGADILDIGGESTRPGATAVSVDDELDRILPVIEGLAGKVRARISVDTRKAEVMQAATAAGADIINDVAALMHEPDCLAAARDSGASIILMHAQGDPRTMQDAPRYGDALLDVFDFLEARVAACSAAGIAKSKLVVDPGLGFGKTLRHNLELMAGLSIFHGIGVPVLLGASRKGFIGTITKVADASARVAGSVGAALAAVGQGAQILRVHDVKATREALDVWLAVSMGVEKPASLVPRP